MYNLVANMFMYKHILTFMTLKFFNLSTLFTLWMSKISPKKVTLTYITQLID
jgi:hypothetical protein